MLSTLLSSSSVTSTNINLVDIVAHRRPTAYRSYDQIYMMTGDMLTQVNLMQDYLYNKDVIFLGDGDGMSMLFGLFAAKEIIQSPKSISVLDFDERIINNVLSFSKEYNINVKFHCDKYNVIQRVPQKYMNKYNFFYINPPYGSKNSGKSCEAWLHRCMDLCKDESSGCIIIPYDPEQKWTIEAMLNIQKFLSEHGFVIRDMVSFMHSYHLKDNPHLHSATIIVDRVISINSEYTSQELPDKLVKNLYGEPCLIPKYIDDDESIKGKPNYKWKYGKKSWLDYCQQPS